MLYIIQQFHDFRAIPRRQYGGAPHAEKKTGDDHSGGRQAKGGKSELSKRERLSSSKPTLAHLSTSTRMAGSSAKEKLW